MVAMERVSIVGQDAALNEALCAILEDVGYGVAVCSEPALALALLRISLRPFVVLVVQDQDRWAQDWGHLLATSRALHARASILQSHQPQTAPPLWNVNTQAVVPIVPLPVDTKLLLTRVGEAGWRLRFVAAANAAEHYAAVHVALRSWDVALSSGRRQDSGSEPERVAVHERLSADDECADLLVSRAPHVAHVPHARTDGEQLRAAVGATRAAVLRAYAVVDQAHKGQRLALEALAHAREGRLQAKVALARARAALAEVRRPAAV